MPGSRPVTENLLEAHLSPIRAEIKQLVRDQREFAQFMTGAINSRSIQEGVRSSRHFWMGFAVSAAGVAAGAIGLLIRLHG